MAKLPFNRDWRVRKRTSLFDEVSAAADPGDLVTLPHDAMLAAGRSRDSGAEAGYFVGGAVEYTKTFDVPDAYRDRRVSIEFDGVYRDAQVFVNGAFVGGRAFGYSRFRVGIDAALRYGAENTIRVEARALPSDTRWYSGMGIHRPVHLLVEDAVHLVDHSVRVETEHLEPGFATIAVAGEIANTTPHTQQVELDVVVRRGEFEVGRETAPVTLRPQASATARTRIHLHNPELWSPDDPNLYDVELVLRSDEDGSGAGLTIPFGIRKVTIDPRHGLRINGVTTKLRGACVHHDNGVLGAAAIARADERRVEILKSAGFNAIRASHNPLSSAMIDACDRLGMLVIDEAFDTWTQSKMAFDYSVSFPEWWHRDLESMVERDFNHPSVIMYSIGNEIVDLGTTLGATWARDLAEATRALDPTRPITNAINGLLTLMIDPPTETPGAGGGLNTTMSEMGDILSQMNVAPPVTERTREPHAIVDVAGMNYGEARYEVDREMFPNRIILGTETYGPKIAKLWELVEANSHVIGDFTWTGWDYLGEAGIGRVTYAGESDANDGLMGSYPTLVAGCGDIDILGHRRPLSFYRETIFGLRDVPYIAVHRPQRHGQEPIAGAWSWDDAISTWTWDVPTGSPVRIDVYSSADEVELRLDGRQIARATVGETRRNIAEFEAQFRPGHLEAIAYTHGEETGRSSLHSGDGVAQLHASVDRHEVAANDEDLAFIEVDIVDSEGVVLVDRDVLVSVNVAGAGRLQGLGSARESTEESFLQTSATTFDGRLLAVVRPVATGEITITISADGFDDLQVMLTARKP
ncbi:glycoside hydrolase family 2 TIM barrel-domain containing protein [Demequina globuliformis]|uniref:glycoside hydrolase family 2 TIM barrel-domain containing protein n=1 Tax=Demequina globuliformis TaxID=676202 RepID=UPI00078284D3|nr:glycoside hydrolase family 2 TIM barrel-domain containing protein [Demequina globuliformis]